MQSRTGAVARLLIVDLIGSVAWFPVWWYTKGFQRMVNAASRALQYRASSYAFRIWIRNFFVPMYGQHDWAGRLVSIFMRFIVLVGRSIAYVVEAAVYGVGLFVWIAAPVAFAILMFWNLTAGAVLKGAGV
jgi:hypothetical protein